MTVLLLEFGMWGACVHQKGSAFQDQGHQGSVVCRYAYVARPVSARWIFC